MYNENGRSYFFRDLIVKVLLVLLFVFLLMWLFPMPNMNPLYDKIFNQNISSMTDSAKGYFTVSRLPKKEGESKKLTLKDMLDNKMIIEFTDSEGKSCDVEKSYVEVTKKDGEYIFKTNLVCSGKEDYVIEHFGCYDVCEDGKCEVKVESTTETKKVTEYQFFKEIKTKYIDKYVCKDGYTLKGTKCVLLKEVEKVENASLKCLNGYSLNKETNKCEKVNVEKLNASLTCPAGYIYASSMNKCIKGTDNEIDATVSYKCDNGVLVGTMCVITNKEVLEAKKVYSCEEGTLNKNNKCEVTTTKEVDAKVNYYCNSGTLSGTSCKIKNADSCGYSKWVCSNKTYTTTVSTSSTPTFTRKYLYMIGTSYVYEECTRTYGCNDGGYSYVSASVSYSCAEGVLNKNNKCDVTTTKEVKAKVVYVCEKGTLNKNNKCEITTTKEERAKKEYVCNVGTLNGIKCEITNIDAVDSVYTCEYGTLSGKYCLVSTKEVIDPIYYCASGYTLADKKCYIVENSSDIVDAEAVYKTKTEKAYKWSREEKLEGWTRTGKTRTVNVNITSKGN